MASIYFTLSKKINPDKKQEILVRFSHGRINQRAKTNIFIQNEYWKDQEIYIPKFRLKTDEIKELQTALTKQADKLNDIKTLIITAFNDSDKNNISPDWLRFTIDSFCFPEKYQQKEEEKKELSFFDLFDEFLLKRSFSDWRKRSFAVVIRMLRRYELFVRKTKKGQKDYTITLDNITTDTLHDLTNYLRNEHIYYEEHYEIYEQIPEYRKQAPRGQNTINDLMTKIRTFFIWANNNEKTQNNPFDKFRIEECVYGTPYYITIEERNILYSTDLSDKPDIEVQRDIFVFQCLIGCRIGDLYRFTQDNIINGAIEYIARKTKDGNPITVRVPLNETAKKILNKYEDREGDKLFPYIHEQEYNKAIKEAFAIAGITRKVTVLDPLTRESTVRPINEIASSHLARRCFVGNLYKQVKDPNLVGALSGHKEGSKAFARYREIDEEIKRDLVKLLE